MLGNGDVVRCPFLFLSSRIMKDQDKLLRVQDVSAKLDVTEDTVRRWARDGKIPCVRIGVRVLRFRESDLDRVLFDMGAVGLSSGIVSGKSESGGERAHGSGALK